MTFFPLGLWDISLWLAITAIVMLIASETLSAYYGRINVLINKERLKNTAVAAFIVSLVIIAIRVLTTLTLHL